MMIFDVILLLAVTFLLGMKNMYLASVTLVIGLLIGFQAVRVQFLIGIKTENVPVSRKIKAVVLALLLTGCGYPFIYETGMNANNFDPDFNSASVLPIIAIIALLSATVMVSLIVEKRKR